MKRLDTKDRILSLVNLVLIVSVCFSATAQGLESDFIFKLTDPIERKIQSLGLSRTGERKTCVASWYGSFFHGRTTANMEIYNKDGISAAHKKLPFNTYLLVTNKKNNKKLIVRVNDRGPYIPGREIDLSEGAARLLGGHEDGLLNISYEILHKA